jgi:protein SCO1/2
VSRRSARIVAVLLTALVTAGWVPNGAAEEQPPQLRGVGIDQRLNEQVPLSLPFRDESGEAVTLGKYFDGRPVILALVYYECPMLCTLVLNGMVSALRTLSFNAGDEFQIVAVSIDPKETSELAAAKKENYLRSYNRSGAEKGVHFLTGEADAIGSLAESLGFRYKFLPDIDEYAHGAAIMVLTPKGKIARYFYGVEYPPRDLRLALVEAAEERIGSPVDQLLLYCYRYDPSTGRYTAVVMNIIRLGGALTVVVLAAFMLTMWRRDARRRKSETIPSDRAEPEQIDRHPGEPAAGIHKV